MLKNEAYLKDMLRFLERLFSQESLPLYFDVQRFWNVRYYQVNEAADAENNVLEKKKKSKISWMFHPIEPLIFL